MPKLGDAYVELRGDDSALRAGLAAAHRTVVAAADRMARAFTAPFRAISAHALPLMIGAGGMFEGIKKSVAAFADFETAMARIGQKPGGAMGEAIRKMAVDFGQSGEGLAVAMRKIQGGGVPAAKSMDVLAVAGRAATAGFTSATAAADAIVTVLNAYHLSADKATAITDLMFAASERGKMSFEELAGSVGEVTTMAATAGISLQEMMANLTTIARSGTGAGEATRAYAMLLRSIIDPQDEVAQAMREAGIDASLWRVQQQGLNAVLRDLNSLSVQEMNKLGGRMHGFQALARLITDVKGREGDLKAMMSAGGMSLAAYGKIADTTATRLARFKEKVVDYLITAGEKLVQVWDAVSKALGPALRAAWQSVEQIAKSAGLGQAFKQYGESFMSIWKNFMPWMQEQIARLPAYVGRIALEIEAEFQKVAYGIESIWYDWTSVARATVSGLGAYIQTTLINAVKGIASLWDDEILGLIQAARGTGVEARMAQVELGAFKVLGFASSESDIMERKKLRMSQVGKEAGQAYAEAFESAIQGASIPWGKLNEKYPLADPDRLREARRQMTGIGDAAAQGMRSARFVDNFGAAVQKGLTSSAAKTGLKLLLGYPIWHREAAPLFGVPQNVEKPGPTAAELRLERMFSREAAEGLKKHLERFNFGPMGASMGGALRWGGPSLIGQKTEGEWLRQIYEVLKGMARQKHFEQEAGLAPAI